MRGKLSGIAAVVAVAAAVAVPVTGASASTSRCTEGVMQPQCGDFVNQSGNGWAVYKQQLQPGTPVIAYPDVRGGKQITSDRSTDFYVFTPTTRAQLNRSQRQPAVTPVAQRRLGRLDPGQRHRPAAQHVDRGQAARRRLLGLEHPGPGPGLSFGR
jgi:hypothetical protein